MSEQIVPQVSQEVKDTIERINQVGERNRREYEALARMTGKSIAEVEADLTAPDPRPDEDGCAAEGCHEDVFRQGLCFEHFVAEETAAWDDQVAERRMVLASVGRIFPVEVCR